VLRARLESLLGVRLFQRANWIVSLTNEGKALLPKINSVLEDLSGVGSSFESKQKIAGTVRVTSVPFIAHRSLISVLTNNT
jgi:DNA-binding transcriptional LysR family regulator